MNKYAISGVIILAIASYFLFFRGGSSTTIDTATVTIGDVLEKVSVTGKISPVSKADLSFQKGGIVAAINVKVGDSVKKGDVIASINDAGDQAILASAEDKLADLTRSLNAPEFALEQSKVNSAKTILSNAKIDALNAARTALVQTQAAVNNYADNFFNNPQSANPTINIKSDSSSVQNAINSNRILVSDILLKWKNSLNLATTSDSATNLISSVNNYVATVKDFMDQLSSSVNNLSPGNSGIPQTVIDADIVTMNSGLAALNQAIASISSAKTSLENASTNYDQAYSNFLLKVAGSSAQSIAAEGAIVDSYKAELAKDKIIAPIDGIVTLAGPNVGEFVSAGVTEFGVIVEGNYKVEAYVPEADIAKISIGNIASTTLDAYRQDVDFPAVVTSIDPAETILEGVPTYKITLKFMKDDARIRSGMTANLDILTRQSSDVIVVPTRAVIDDNGDRSVRVLNPDGKTFIAVPVKVGLRGSEGTTEVISGLSKGEKVVTYVK